MKKEKSRWIPKTSTARTKCNASRIASQKWCFLDLAEESLWPQRKRTTVLKLHGYMNCW